MSTRLSFSTGDDMEFYAGPIYGERRLLCIGYMDGGATLDTEDVIKLRDYLNQWLAGQDVS